MITAIYFAELETRNFSFTAWAETESDARLAVMMAWDKHVALTDADPRYVSADDVTVRRMRIATGYRDGRPL